MTTVSIILDTKSNGPIEFKDVHQYRFTAALHYLKEFKDNNPSMKIFNSYSYSGTGSAKTSQQVTEIQFENQAQFDEYLTNPLNYKTVTESVLADSDVAAWCSANNNIVTISVVEDSGTTVGLDADNTLLNFDF
jgi:hypothetical protein